jgi:hypothetical protein
LIPTFKFVKKTRTPKYSTVKTFFIMHGSSNLTKSEQVFGVQDPYIGEFGISTHPESYDVYAGLTFHTDVKEGLL